MAIRCHFGYRSGMMNRGEPEAGGFVAEGRFRSNRLKTVADVTRYRPGGL
jgi:hypothetical protein